MPATAQWKEELGDLEPIAEFPPGKRPTVRDVLKLLRFHLKTKKLPRRTSAVEVASKLEERHPGSSNGTINFTVKRLLGLWDQML